MTLRNADRALRLMLGPSDQLRAIVRMEGRRFAGHRWKATATGLLFHGDEGHWGRIDVVVAMNAEHLFGDPKTATVPIQLGAGVSSPYLLEVVNRRDPSKAPPRGYSHAWLLSQVEVRYDLLSNTALPPPLTLPQPDLEELGITLGPDTVALWFHEAFALLVGSIEELASDLALRDYLVESAGPTNAMNYRTAALLTRRLGRNAEVPELLERAAAAGETAKRLYREATGQELPSDDRDTSIMMWSDQKFARYFDFVSQT